MKSIELTEEHKAKLLEMCKVLFPEYSNLEVRDSMEDFCMKQDNLFIELNEAVNRRDCTVIHWFEFCNTHLLKIISENLAQQNSSKEWSGDDKMFEKWNIIDVYHKKISKGLISWINHEHPIDYLYKEFKKLKHEKI